MRRCVFGLVAALVGLACEVPDFKPLEVGDPAPGFSATTLEGTPITEKDLLGAPYMLNIWATWCAPCREEMPELQELHNAYAGPGLPRGRRQCGRQEFRGPDRGVHGGIGNRLPHLSRSVVGDRGRVFAVGAPRDLPRGRRGARGAEVDGALPADGGRTFRTTCKRFWSRRRPSPDGTVSYLSCLNGRPRVLRSRRRAPR